MLCFRLTAKRNSRKVTLPPSASELNNNSSNEYIMTRSIAAVKQQTLKKQANNYTSAPVRHYNEPLGYTNEGYFTNTIPSRSVDIDNVRSNINESQTLDATSRAPAKSSNTENKQKKKKIEEKEIYRVSSDKYKETA